MDKDGNSNIETGLRIAYKERVAKKKVVKLLVIILII